MYCRVSVTGVWIGCVRVYCVWLDIFRLLYITTNMENLFLLSTFGFVACWPGSQWNLCMELDWVAFPMGVRRLCTVMDFENEMSADFDSRLNCNYRDLIVFLLLFNESWFPWQKNICIYLW